MIELSKGVSKKGIIQDLILNIAASFLLTAILQLIIFPGLSNKLSVSSFGTLLTLNGLSNAFGVMFGASLNNIQLLNQHNDKGNYRILLNYTYIIILSISIVVSIMFTRDMNIIDGILFLSIPILTMLRSYMNVYYRIKINYKYIFIHTVVTGIGYITGLLIFRLIELWTVVFIIGELFAFTFAYRTTDFKREKCIRTDEYIDIRNQYTQLVIANSVANLLTYLDRLIINPILGAGNVAVYFIASMIGKTVGIVLQPISSIMLTYLSKIKTINEKKLFIAIVSIIIVFGGGVFLITIPTTPILVKLLYIDSFELAKPYFNLANLASILMIMGSLIQALVLRYCPIWWQSIIQIAYAIVYLGLGIIIMINYGLYGFCLVAILANLLRVILLISVGYYYIFKGNEEKFPIAS